MTIRDLREIVKTEGVPDCCSGCQKCTDDNKCEIDMHDVSSAVRLGTLSYGCKPAKLKLGVEDEERKWEAEEKLFFESHDDISNLRHKGMTIDEIYAEKL